MPSAVPKLRTTTASVYSFAMSKAKRDTAPRSRRLTADDWIDSGLKILAHRGEAHVRVERLAHDLRVTKGSFYWHFESRDALLEAMLKKWRTRTVEIAQQSALQSGPDPLKRLRAYLELPQTAPDLAEGVLILLAVQLWARRNKRARTIYLGMQRMHDRRIKELLGSLGIRRAQTDSLAAICGAVLMHLFATPGRSKAESTAVVEMLLTMIGRQAATDTAARS